MRVLFFMLISFTLLAKDPLRTSKINKAKSKARDAFNAGKFEEAISLYKYLKDSLDVQEDEVNLNLAHAYYLAKDTANAQAMYQGLTASAKSQVSSISNQQLGIMANAKGKPDEALNYFKQALRADPENEQARYNYEMLKKKLDKKKKEDEQKKKDQQNKDNQNEEPSEFAKKLKAQADKLVAQKLYNQAYELMMNGLKQDKTVSTYQDYINRIKIVSDINQ